MSPNEDIVKTEQLVLRAICLAPAHAAVRETGFRLLKDYRWHEPVHEAIFQSLSRLSAHDPESIRRLLPSYLTRYGYPDVDFAALMVPHGLSENDARRLMKELKLRD